MAVVAACIAYEQLAITQCGITDVYAIIQNYVACGYIAVFIYYEAAVCTIECTVAVYEERYSAVFICSTYGQVVFCVQCVGLNIVYINVFVQLNLNFSAVMAYYLDNNYNTFLIIALPFALSNMRTSTNSLTIIIFLKSTVNRM